MTVRQATWDEIDVEAGVWTAPSEHMKMRRPHRVPLSTGALAVLQKAQEPTTRVGLVFPSNRKAGALSNMAFTMLLRRAGYDHITTHGFRSSFRDWTLEQTDAPWAVAEAALAHNLGGGEVMAPPCPKRSVRAAAGAHATVGRLRDDLDGPSSTPPPKRRREGPPEGQPAVGPSSQIWRPACLGPSPRPPGGHGGASGAVQKFLCPRKVRLQ